MSFISEAASAIKSRFGFHDPHLEPQSVKSTPSLKKTSSFTDIVQSAVPSTPHSYELSEDPSLWKDFNVQVIIRARPLNNTEISLQGYSKCVKQESSQTITWTGHPETRFTFDAVADETISQEKLFKVAGVPMVENCVGGYNSCMFAYGQTGSGKTHTMLGDREGGTRRYSVNCGITPRVKEFRRLAFFDKKS